MENQHQQITGYRELNQAEIDKINQIKAKGQEFADLIDGLNNEADIMPDQRHLAIARTHVETGVMFLIKSVAKPTTSF